MKSLSRTSAAQCSYIIFNSVKRRESERITINNYKRTCLLKDTLHQQERERAGTLSVVGSYIKTTGFVCPRRSWNLDKRRTWNLNLQKVADVAGEISIMILGAVNPAVHFSCLIEESSREGCKVSGGPRPRGSWLNGARRPTREACTVGPVALKAPPGLYVSSLSPATYVTSAR
ncbi:hypothetical protein ACJJTC_003194 [Scirpophaga incertulas]